MGLSRVHDASARAAFKIGTGITAGADVTVKKTTSAIDVNALATGEGRPYFAEVVVTGQLTTATGAAGDTVDITLSVDDSPTSGGTYTERVSKVALVTVNADNNTKQFVAVLEVPLFDLTQFVKFSVLAAMTAGATGTLSAATGSVAIRYSAFSRDRLSQADGKEGYADQTPVT